jgi:hypothetical protein
MIWISIPLCVLYDRVFVSGFFESEKNGCSMLAWSSLSVHDQMSARKKSRLRYRSEVSTRDLFLHE